MDATPYYSCCGRGSESRIKTYDAAGNIVQAPLSYDNCFVPRGYATVLVDLAGTDRSDGCVDVGWTFYVQSAKAVVDWLNGRAKGYGARSGGHAVTASWTNGSVGVIGKSWDGAVANGAVATGVRGLKTIVSLRRWFDHYLLGVDNGIQREPMADVERGVGHWSTDPVWPAPGTRGAARALGPTATNGLGTAPAAAARSASGTAVS